MSYYYYTTDGQFIDSSHFMAGTHLIPLNEQQYAITRLLVKGYTAQEIKDAVDEVVKIMNEKNKK